MTASRPAGTWQLYGIAFEAPRFDARGQAMTPARVTVVRGSAVERPWDVLTGPSRGKMGGGARGQAPQLVGGDPANRTVRDPGRNRSATTKRAGNRCHEPGLEEIGCHRHRHEQGACRS